MQLASEGPRCCQGAGMCHRIHDHMLLKIHQVVHMFNSNHTQALEHAYLYVLQLKAREEQMALLQSQVEASEMLRHVFQ
jgi:hypothetical protein